MMKRKWMLKADLLCSKDKIVIAPHVVYPQYLLSGDLFLIFSIFRIRDVTCLLIYINTSGLPVLIQHYRKSTTSWNERLS